MEELPLQDPVLQRLTGFDVINSQTSYPLDMDRIHKVLSSFVMSDKLSIKMTFTRFVYDLYCFF